MAKSLEPAAGYYTIEIGTTTWTVPERYQDLTSLSSGAYGLVCSALDTKYGIKVAIKKIPKPFYHHLMAKRTYRELRILQFLKQDNCIGLLDVFTPANDFEHFSDVYLVSQLMETDLSRLLKEQQSKHRQIISEDHVKCFVYQILCGLKYVHSAGIIHRDLKPENIAINSNCDLKILDFGLARTSDDDMTGYVATRYWRAPEIMLQWKHYDKKVDLWSVGCIMAELLTGSALFPAPNQLEHLNAIFQVIGTPDKELLDKLPSEKTRLYLQSLPELPRKDLGNLLGIRDPEAVDLLDNLLVVDPERRFDVEQALSHSYLSEYSDPEFEITAPIYNDEQEYLEFESEGWRDAVWKEIQSFVPDQNLYSQLIDTS